MSLHHTDDVPCPLCEQKLKQADTRLLKWFTGIKELFPHVHISCSYRGQADQDKAYADGKSLLKYPLSKHNSIDINGRPRSLALDLFALTEDGVALWPVQLFAKINAEHMPKTMRWGGIFKSIGDSCHFEITDLDP